MKNLWIGTGWKMNHLMSDAMLYTDKIKDYCNQRHPSSNIFICVPFTVLYAVTEKLKDSQITVASQNVHWLDRGAATGEISPLMIKDAGASMVEIGHSERRAMFAETDMMVNAKVKAVLQNGLRPLVCIGETAQDKEMGLTIEKLTSQLKIAFHQVSPSQAENILVAYEPVWAIGESGSPASPEYADQVHAHIKKVLWEIFGKQAADIPVLYGGSVNPQNALPLISQEHIDGLFIGRAAWNVDGFIDIISMVEDFVTSELPVE
jgi:triosephosphate isomerase